MEIVSITVSITVPIVDLLHSLQEVVRALG